MKKFYLSLALICLAFFSYGQNYGLLFNGQDTRLEVDHKPAFNVTDTYTIEAWIYANAWKDQAWMGSIVNKDTQGPDRGYAFRAGDNGRLSFVMAVDNTWNEVQTTALMNTEQWHHVAVVINNGLMTLYVDGEPSATNSYSGTISPNDLVMNIGASPGFGGRHFDGIIDEVRMWNVARSQAEIADNISTEFTGSEDNLVAYFPMNEGSGNVATNLVDSDCSATASNMTQDNWIDGYAIPDYDLSILPIQGVDVVNMKNRPVKISVQIKNLGTEALSDIDLTVAVDGSDQFTETLPSALASGAQTTYEFQTPVDLTGLDNPELTISGFHPEDQNSLNNSKSITLITQDGNKVRLFDSEAHNFGSGGQNHYNSVLLPASLSEYQTLLLHIDVACPSGGCDPWDQPANISAVTDAGSFEIARYTTPFGIACGPWTVDVTDFKGLLAGPVTFHSYVQVWGQSGWLVTIDLELIEGNDPTPYRRVSNLWSTDYWVYGDPDINDDLPVAAVDVHPTTETSHVRMTITGHGQGNTNNAAEFYQTTHQLQLNGSSIDNHNLWKPDCPDNPCSDQQGTWLFPRAGWCPGQEVIPYVVNTTSTADPGTTIELDYELADYTNALNTGYNGGSHTEPHFRIWSYFVESSSTPYEDYLNLATDAITPTVSGMGAGETLDELTITISNTGNVPMSDFTVSYFINNELFASDLIEMTLSVGESMTHTFSTLSGFNPGSQNVFFGVVSHPDDENIGDDVAKDEVGTPSSTAEVEAALRAVQVFPNPSIDRQVQVIVPSTLVGSTFQLLTATGQNVGSGIITSEQQMLQVPQAGVFFLHLQTEDGAVTSRKLTVIE